MAPPERPLPDEDVLLLIGAAVEDEMPPDVDDGNSGGIEDVGGRVTPVQRPVTLDAVQQESVELGELEAQ